ncbi:hypothetical protein K438DRAFT_1752660 [Mycena galopus ATCC 62051]|nr:hypothetical protein K438DRAFT_1752660 [Mycena galopus ATCC 62051]
MRIAIRELECLGFQKCRCVGFQGASANNKLTSKFLAGLHGIAVDMHAPVDQTICQANLSFVYNHQGEAALTVSLPSLPPSLTESQDNCHRDYTLCLARGVSTPHPSPPQSTTFSSRSLLPAPAHCLLAPHQAASRNLWDSRLCRMEAHMAWDQARQLRASPVVLGHHTIILLEMFRATYNLYKCMMSSEASLGLSVSPENMMAQGMAINVGNWSAKAAENNFPSWSACGGGFFPSGLPPDFGYPSICSPSETPEEYENPEGITRGEFRSLFGLAALRCKLEYSRCLGQNKLIVPWPRSSKDFFRLPLMCVWIVEEFYVYACTLSIASAIYQLSLSFGEL